MAKLSYNKPVIKMSLSPIVYDGHVNGQEIVCKVTPYGLGEKVIKVKVAGLENFNAGEYELPPCTSFGYALRMWVESRVKLMCKDDYIGNSVPEAIETPEEVL